MDKIKLLSQNFLLKILSSPGGFSFVPSEFLWVERFNLAHYKEQISRLDTSKSNNLYIHIPFCKKVCSYCNCYKVKITKNICLADYTDLLVEQINLFKGKNIKLDSIFIGGGTANLLTESDLNKLFKAINEVFEFNDDIQILIDGHPNFYTKSLIDTYKDLGFTRITFAIQTLNENVLELNNRDGYVLDELLDLIAYARLGGIKVNIDLMAGIKGQSHLDTINDIEFLKNKVDNISIHYLMKSNNFSYELPENYLEICNNVKLYLAKNPLYFSDENKQESIYAKGLSNIIGIGAESVSSFSGISTFKMPQYSKLKDFLNLEYVICGKKLSKNDELFRFILLNCKPFIDIDRINSIFKIDFLTDYRKELVYLHKKGIVKLVESKIIPQVTDLEYYSGLMIFMIDDFSKMKKFDKNVKKGLLNYFDLNGNLIDE